MRLIAVGDIHGHLDKLTDLIDQIQPAPDDQLVFLGDYIDRGPDSKGVLDYLITLRQQHPETVFLRGNHEQMMLDALYEAHPERLPGDWNPLPGFRSSSPWPYQSAWLGNGGVAVFASFGTPVHTKVSESGLPWGDVPQRYIDFLVATSMWHRQDGFFFVHAGMNEIVPLEKQRVDMLWERYASPGRFQIHVVGHSPTLDGQPFFEGGRYSLDTGAAYGRPLTACDVLTREIWQSASTAADTSRTR